MGYSRDRQTAVGRRYGLQIGWLTIGLLAALILTIIGVAVGLSKNNTGGGHSTSPGLGLNGENGAATKADVRALITMPPPPPTATDTVSALVAEQTAERSDLVVTVTSAPAETTVAVVEPGPTPTTPATSLPVVLDGEELTRLAATPPPLPTPRESYSWTLKVPILMYHYISVPPVNADKYRLSLSVTPVTFRNQMQFLVDNGYETVDLYDLSLAIVGEGELPEKPVIITVDDGYRDNYENAFPILQELGLRATFFVATEFVDQHNPNYMDWVMIEEMAAAGMRFEPHSKTHPDLTLRDRAFIIWEVLGSQETLEAHIGYRPRYFAYPSGRYNEEVLAIVEELDFWGAVTTEAGNWHGFKDRFEWTRLRIINSMSPEVFADLLE